MIILLSSTKMNFVLCFNEMEIKEAMSETVVIYGILCREKLQGGTNIKD